MKTRFKKPRSHVFDNEKQFKMFKEKESTTT